MVIISILQYILLLIIILFLIWLSLISIIYQNKKCYSIEIEKHFLKNKKISFNSSIIDSRLKLNHFTLLGTHNSYHIENLLYKYSHQDLDKQLSFRIRQIELDIHLMKNNHLVYHLQLFDDKTNCYCFNECLMLIAKWTNKYRYHFPIYLFIEIKQMFYEDLFTGLGGGVKCHHFKSIKEEILQIFSLNTFILPEQIQGNETSIKSALKKQREHELSGDYTYKNYGWPPTYQSLGKIIPVFIDDKHNIVSNLYLECDLITSFFFIAQKNLDLPYSSIISISDPIKSKQLLIDSAINGKLIRLLLGYGNKNLDESYQLSKPYGIHIISSDSVKCNDTQLCQSLANDFQNLTVICNSYFAPSFCKLSIRFI